MNKIFLKRIKIAHIIYDILVVDRCDVKLFLEDDYELLIKILDENPDLDETVCEVSDNYLSRWVFKGLDPFFEEWIFNRKSLYSRLNKVIGYASIQR